MHSLELAPRYRVRRRFAIVEATASRRDALVATTLQDQLQHALGDRYRIARELTPGGMSRLFLATEESLDRQVVVKLLPPEAASEVSAERFRREMLVTARLQHPHILPVLHAGTREGLLYYVMPYVAGESLRVRMERERALPTAEALRIVRELADALACAHTAGIVHRDVKPENVLLEHNHAVLADFGVARALEHTSLSGRLTSTGLGLGTPGYMAPEQFGGETVDARADLYALGVIAYEMLAGEPLFAGVTTPQRLIAAHLTERPRSLATLRSDVSPELSALVARLLEKEPDARPQTADEVLRALDAIPVARVDAPTTSTDRRDAPAPAAYDTLIELLTGGSLLTREQRAFITSAFVPRTYRKGEFYQRAGEFTTHGAFVARGLFRNYAIDANGNESIVKFSPERTWIGDFRSATSGEPTPYFVEALETSDVLRIDLQSFMQMARVIPEHAERYARGLHRGQEATERRLALYLHASAEERFADFAASHPALVERVPPAMLASYLGMTPEELSRLRRDADAR
jgi:serine/threonine-protein kinase